MQLRIFDHKFFDTLSAEAKSKPRLRQHKNVHVSHREPCQRLFNAIEPGSYIRPHRHASDPKEELLIAIRGNMALVTFDDLGDVKDVVKLANENEGTDVCHVVEVSPREWHTVIAFQPNCVLLEVKAGPFNPGSPKDLAPWAPDESSPEAAEYLKTLTGRVENLEQR
jgi:cupin fold WbuC family metalloprotein